MIKMKKARVQAMISKDILKRIDKAAAKVGCTRSYWLEMIARERLKREK